MMSYTKTLVGAFAIALIASAPAMAKSHAQHPQPLRPAVPSATVSPHSAFAPDGSLLGIDPDINVRQQMMRDWPTQLHT